MNLVKCPNCHGRDSSHWPFGPCTICNGTGKTTPEKADFVYGCKADNALEESRRPN